MTIHDRPSREAAYFGMPWESAYGYAQAVKAGGVIYLSGQLSHDETGNLVAPATLDSAGRVIDSSNMALQMQTTYENARRLLANYGATLDDVVEEVIYVTDFEAAFAVAGKDSQGRVRNGSAAMYEHNRRSDALGIPPAARGDQLYRRRGRLGADAIPSSSARVAEGEGP
jgi:enamine deaminase RidA (YjgF/YER057c/UK114 family)